MSRNILCKGSFRIYKLHVEWFYCIKNHSLSHIHTSEPRRNPEGCQCV